ncbi:hypothetical protein [Paraconexibacter sp.]|uniref:hypothetical protein n=1 Tax=Paraconexibacter sp. TaxID=2949640 RepID=UPI0035612B99
MSRPLVCPRCASTHPLTERFCPDCRMPLTYAGADGVDQPITEAHERARKIKPQLSEGELVRVAGGRNQAEAEFIAGMLLEEGIPSLIRRSRGFDVPDMLAAGPRDVLVPASGVSAAREVLLEAELVSDTQGSGPPPARLLAWLVGLFAGAALVIWLATELAG